MHELAIVIDSRVLSRSAFWISYEQFTQGIDGGFMRVKNLVVAFLLALGIVALASHPALAHNPGKPGHTVSDTGSPKGIHPLASCSGTGCNGQDPVDSGCATSPTTLDFRDFSYNSHSWEIQQRYSSTCQTRWTRLVQTDGSGACLNGSSGLIGITGPWLGAFTVSGVCNGAYTDMGYNPIHSNASGSYASNGTSNLSSFNYT
jgi:hypothetical protein